MTTVDQVAPLEPAVAALPAGPPLDPASAAMPVASRLIGAIAVGVALLSAAATFVVLAGLTPIAPVHEVVVKLLLADLAGGLFFLATTALVAVVASPAVDRRLDRFFSTRTRAMIEQSLIVADAYVSEHAQAIRGEIMAMAFDLGRANPMFDSDRDRFQKFFTAQATARGLSAAMIIHADGSTVARADVTMDKAIVLPSAKLLGTITETEPQVALIPEGDHVAAAVKLHGYDDMYLYAARVLDPRVVEQSRATQES